MTLLLWLCVIGIALWMALKYLPAGTERFRPLPEAVALIPLLIAPLVLVAIVALFTHHRAPLAIAIVLIIVQLVWQTGYVIPIPDSWTDALAVPRQTVAASTSASQSTGSTQSAGSAQSAQSSDQAQSSRTLRVMNLNTRYGRADTGSIVHEVEMDRIDVLAVEEINDDFVKRMQDSHIADQLPYLVLGDSAKTDNGGFNAIWSRYRITDFSTDTLSIHAAAVPSATVDVDGAAVTVAAVHTKSPARSGADWSQGIRNIGLFGIEPTTRHALIAQAESTGVEPTEQIEQTASGSGSIATGGTATPAAATPRTVVLGDMNASVYHPSFRYALALGRKAGGPGLADSSFELHRGWHNTFPATWPGFPALIEIDHVLHTPGLKPNWAKTVKIPRADHKALIVELRVV
ncbi:endonuclease/exonuclease/phosphatase family protein [Bifidobacterium simiarum]|uniref:endonuclease/exonuclease/phosphatase family protein n=1 Tax=Bifidobacterium simiarum TaxID=2045441 RepID=UPI001BDD3B78|nr:endonuclease/exonuclease/phosphatase family protein [Bifidobacterium simiarum]MBT1166431.1 endonuclease/exonuclease/phosphatase family protein [Bifidobacterium simiarum]